MSGKTTRCAVYTRKSSDEGLDQAFNSLHAQREACEAYIKSQAHEGWRLIKTAYDDGGVSGGTLDREALKRLLLDVDRGLVDTIVVYKIDRLTRSLADFARIVERLEARGASFVSVTQAFNTTTSMGRLTLNVLLSFAQFEREVTGERIRDKIAASKKKGMWMGGVLPLGYDSPTDPATRSLVVNPEEADTVRQIFGRYLELGSVTALVADLDLRGVRSKAWTSRAGRRFGGVRFSRGALYHLLKNRTYLGEIPHRDQSYPAAHPAIVDRDVFDRVQARLAEQTVERAARPLRYSNAPLKGLLVDGRGRPLSPSFGYGRGGVVYRYYAALSSDRAENRTRGPNIISRVSAPAIEARLSLELASILRRPEAKDLRELLDGVSGVQLTADGVAVTIARSKVPPAARARLDPSPGEDGRGVLFIPMTCKVRGGRTVIHTPSGSPPIIRRNPALIRGLRQAHALAAGIGWRMGEGPSPDAGQPQNPYHRKLIKLAFLSPSIQKAIIEGRQPPEMTLETLIQMQIPLDWDRQGEILGVE